VKTLDAKLATLAVDPAGNDFIVCYAADPDMGGGLRPTVAQGVDPVRWRDQMAEIVENADIDILLASVSTMADDPVVFTELLRAVADGQLSPEDACREYHGRLAAAGITPSRTLEEDLVVDTPELKV